MPQIPSATGGSGPAYQQLATTIRTSIMEGELTEGQRLPSEVALAGEAGVSRSTVREALRVLQESGFIERSSPKIFVVRAHTEEPAVRAVSHALRRRTVTFAALHEALLLLEPELTRLAALRHDEEDLAALRRILDAQRESLDDFARWCRLDEEFHETIAEASANAPLVLARASLGQVLVPTVAQFLTTERAAIAGTVFHERIYDSIVEGDGDLAALVARRHVEDFRQAWEHSGLEYDRDISALIDAATLVLTDAE
ncbi:MAG TPA: FCD domain-containing protein [Baekduia sp.]|nr:FCD domain-containing protein [Baekduia sp.]